MIEDKIIEYLKDKDKKIEIVYLFGSAVRGELRDKSDIDIAIVGTFDSMEMFDIKFELEEAIGRDIDLIDFKKIDTSFQAEIISSGRVLYAKDEYKKDQLEMKTLSMYLTLEEDRAVVMEAIKERGSVFLWKE